MCRNKYIYIIDRKTLLPLDRYLQNSLVLRYFSKRCILGTVKKTLDTVPANVDALILNCNAPIE